jgi:hypothetical protein
MVYVAECKADMALLKILTAAPKKNLIHGGNKTGVLQTLLKGYEDSTGVIDEDPWSIQPPDLQRFQEKQDLTSYNFKILHQKSKNNKLIILCPRLEEWILQAARESSISPTQYGSPDDAHKLHEQVNLQTDKFQKFVDSLQNKSRQLKELKKHLTRGLSSK